ncbi:hypothetical protein [Halanaerobaculum tunisiense]
MRWLTKRLALLFFLIAIVIISLTGIANKLGAVVILKRTLLSGVIFSLLGGIIGQLISYQLDKIKSESAKQEPTIESADESEAKELSQEDTAEEIEELDFAEVDQEEENIVNFAEDNPEEMADLVSNLEDQE